MLGSSLERLSVTELGLELDLLMAGLLVYTMVVSLAQRTVVEKDASMVATMAVMSAMQMAAVMASK